MNRVAGKSIRKSPDERMIGMKKVLLRCVFGAMRSILILITAAIALCASAICILRSAQALERLAQIAGTAVLFS